jgi:hypothetical protein
MKEDQRRPVPRPRGKVQADSVMMKELFVEHGVLSPIIRVLSLCKTLARRPIS